jgi:dTDP-4-amino-4,6-dideoxygalactose transaminase
VKPLTVPYCKPSLGKEEAAALKEAFESGWVGSGAYVRTFEARVAAALGRPCVAATNSGTAALHLALKLLDLEGAEVLTSPLTVPATNHAILHNRATPVFCDVEEETGNIDCRKLEQGITRRTKAIVVVHLNGLACDMDAVLAVARNNGLAVVEDACAALPIGGSYKGRPLGSIGDLGCFSFSGLKNLTAMDGGAVAHSRPEWAARLTRLKNSGHSPGEMTEPGFHYRMNDVAAVIGLAQWKRWDAFAAALGRTQVRYMEGLSGLSEIVPPREEPHSPRALLYFPIRVRGGRKMALRSYLEERGIETGDWLFPNHLYDVYKPFRRPLPVAEKVAAEILYLPFHPLLKASESDRVIDAIRGFARPRPARKVPRTRRRRRSR